MFPVQAVEVEEAGGVIAALEAENVSKSAEIEKTRNHMNDLQEAGAKKVMK
jgi:hypothetical protein